MINLVIFGAMSAISIASTISLLIAKKQQAIMEMEIADFKNREIEIQAKVEDVKDKIQSISNLYVATDKILNLKSDNAVYEAIASTVKELYNPQQLILYSFDESKNIFEQKCCLPDSNKFSKSIQYKDMHVKEYSNPKELSIMVKNSKNKPLYYLKINGKRINSPTGCIPVLFTEIDSQVTNIFLNQSAMLLEKIHAYDYMERAALTDGLTGLYNRHYAYIRIKEEIKRAIREQYPISVIFIDIDKFKFINDSFGHDVGDLALKHVSNIITSFSREYDVAVRWGGEEFLMFLANSNERESYVLAERLRMQIENCNFEYCPITVSLGISTFPDDNDDIEKIISNADSSLYFSKENGRNRTTVFSQIKHLVAIGD